LVRLSCTHGRQNQGVRLGESGYQRQYFQQINIPESYAIVPNRIELDQGVVRIERVPDTVQTDHVDWGFRFSPMYDIDYRWTTAHRMEVLEEVFSLASSDRLQ
jgi:hypothetical protein